MRTLCRLLTSCTLAMTAARADATVLVPASLADLAREAGAIVRGRVISAESRFTPDRRTIETLVTLNAEDTLKGSLGSTVAFLVPGGTLGRYRSLFVGAPSFTAGERVVVFLGWRGPSYPYLIGLGQGVFRLQGEGLEARLAVPLPAPAPPSTAGAVVRGNPARRPLPLADFERQVRGLVAGNR